MYITDGIETDVEYYYDRTDGWDWFGTPRWWEIFVVIHGICGGPGLSIVKLWRWNGSSETLRREHENLSWEESREMLLKLLANKKTPDAAILEAAEECCS